MRDNFSRFPIMRRKPWKLPVKKKPVTLIVGIICKDAIVLAADGQTTKGDAKYLGANKINSVSFKNGAALVAESGSADLSNRAIELFKKKAESITIESESDVTKAAIESMREVLRDITAVLRVDSPDFERQDFLSQEVNYYELMLAFYFGNRAYLYLIKSSWCIPIPCNYHFATSGIASDLATYVLKEHTSPGMDKDLASVIAIKTAKDAIDNVEGCGLPVRVAMIHKPQRVRAFKLVVKPGEHIAERVYGETTTQPSWIKIFGPEKVTEIIQIVSEVENQFQDKRNQKFHAELKRKSDAYYKKMEKE
jgi:20S proteasome alpha/beta subunit